MKQDIPHILLINPWIHDFAAYDFWAKPMGLLILASILEQHGYYVSYIDSLDRFHTTGLCSANPTYAEKGLSAYNKGRYLKTRIPKPEGLEDIPRYFSRYGIQPELFRDELQAIPKPDLILVTSLMTYWYPGVQESIHIIKKIFPNVPLILGGIYARLCYEHAVKYSGADEVINQAGEKIILDLVKKYTGCSVSLKFDPDNLNTYPYPAFHLQKKINYIPILTSRGCPFSCAYCASHFLEPKLMRRDTDLVTEEIRYWHNKYGIKDFIFYDDALLTDVENHAVPLFEGIIKTGLDIRFHTPNAVHIRGISQQTAHLMFRAGFKTLRLGLETAVFEKRNELDIKVTETEFRQAASYLKEAGFTKDQLGAYLLVGLPEQSFDSVEASVRILRQNNITPFLAFYSPIPHTSLWKKAVASSRYDMESDPIFTNNSILPCSQEFSMEKVSYLKSL